MMTAEERREQFYGDARSYDADELWLMKEYAKDYHFEQLKQVISKWVAFDFNKKETHPKTYDKYLICRKDGKIHWETWNGSGWAYNHNEIRYWASIKSPIQSQNPAHKNNSH